MWPFLGLSLSFMISILLKSTMAFILMFGHDDVCPIFYSLFIEVWTSLVAEMVKNPPATRETWVWSLGWEDPLAEGMATDSSILAWRIPWTGILAGYSPWGSQRIRPDWVTKHSISIFFQIDTPLFLKLRTNPEAHCSLSHKHDHSFFL